MGWHIFDASAAGLKAVSIAVDAKVSSMRGSIQRRTHRGECSSKLNWNIAKTEVFAVQTLWLHSLGLRLSLPVLNAWKRPIFMHKLEQSCRICKQQTKARCAYAMLTNKTSWNWNKQSTNTLGHTQHTEHTQHTTMKRFCLVMSTHQLHLWTTPTQRGYAQLKPPTIIHLATTHESTPLWATSVDGGRRPRGWTKVMAEKQTWRNYTLRNMISINTKTAKGVQSERKMPALYHSCTQRKNS